MRWHCGRSIGHKLVKVIDKIETTQKQATGSVSLWVKLKKEKFKKEIRDLTNNQK